MIAFVCISGFCLLCYLLINWTDYPTKFVEQLVYATAKFQYPNDLGCRSKVSLVLPICLQYYTPASNLGYLAPPPPPPPGQFFMGAKLFIGTPWMGNEGVLKKILVWAM